jgi:hypothetical protein
MILFDYRINPCYDTGGNGSLLGGTGAFGFLSLKVSSPTTMGTAIMKRETHMNTYPIQLGIIPVPKVSLIWEVYVPVPNATRTPYSNMHKPGQPHSRTATIVPMIPPVFEFLFSIECSLNFDLNFN